MATIDTKWIIKTLLENDGNFEGDSQAYSIHIYINNWGKTTHHVAHNPQEEASMFKSPYCHAPSLLWNRRIGFTSLGVEYLKTLQAEESKEEPNEHTAETTH